MGGIAASGVGSLQFIDGVMDQYKYIDIIKKKIKKQR